MTRNNLIFDRVRQQSLKEKAHQNFNHDSYFLHHEIESILQERISFFKQKFERALVSGPTSLNFKQALFSQGQGHDLFVSANSLEQILSPDMLPSFPLQCLKIDEEKVPFQTHCFDLIISFLELQSLNHIPLVLFQNRHLLRSPGLYMGILIGGDSFYELRTSLLQAEIEITQGAKPRIHPMIDVETAVKLFTQAGFIEPVVDRQFFTINYSSVTTLLKEIKILGEGNSLIERARTPLHRAVLQRAEEIYKNSFSDQQGQLYVTIEVIFLTGWA